jgi:hypothetical protein
MPGRENHGLFIGLNLAEMIQSTNLVAARITYNLRDPIKDTAVKFIAKSGHH